MSRTKHALYETLGLPPNATKPQIRAAYRAQAKRHHPDAGGNQAAFQQLRLAHDTLLDDTRRARYDATGEAEDTAADNTNAELLNHVAKALNLAMKEAFETAIPLAVDILEVARRNLRAHLADVRKDQANITRQRDLQQQVASRVVTQQRDIIGTVLRAQITGLNAAIERCTQEITLTKAALAVFETYSFTPDAPPAGAPFHPVFTFLNAGARP
jgi:curved DNA-binding protein CbpA